MTVNADALSLSVRRRFSSPSARPVTWSVVNGMCVRGASDGQTLLFADLAKGLLSMDLRTERLQTLYKPEREGESWWGVVNVTELDEQTLLLLEWNSM